MTIDMGYYKDLFDGWLIVIDDIDADFGLKLKPDAPKNIIELFQEFKAQVETYAKRKVKTG